MKPYSIHIRVELLHCLLAVLLVIASQFPCGGQSDDHPLVPFAPGRETDAEVKPAAYLQDRALQPPPSNRGPFPVPPELQGVDLMSQSRDEALAKSQGCVSCHENVTDMHRKPTIYLGCTDCHGGNADVMEKELAHVQPHLRDAWPRSANPIRSYTLLNHENPAFVRFVNPGDLRVAHLSCGMAGCHTQETLQVRKSMMTHGCMLWGAALYNNGAVPQKWPRYGEAYSMNGTPLRLQTVPPPSEDEMAKEGVLPFLDPLPRFEITQPGNILRIFERGGRFVLNPGIPEALEEPGRPRARLSNRGLGTGNRTDPVFIGLQKTRLLDPTLNFLGTNDHPGDYRSSGCTACHVIYANDRSPVNSGPYWQFGNRGQSFSQNPMIPKDESGHPITHQFVLGVPSSQCIVCHVHPGTNVMNSYLGFMWWDNETDGELMYPKHQRHPTAEEIVRAQMSNPDEASIRGLWSDPEFLAEVSQLNSKLRHTQFADFHGHGWVFRAVFKKDRKGNLLDYQGTPLANVTNESLQRAMEPPTPEEVRVGKQREDTPLHYLDIHLEKGMHCVDCHFRQDVHGNTKLYGEVRAAIEITCTDCHGTVNERAPGRKRLATSGPAARKDKQTNEKIGMNLLTLNTPFGKPRFEIDRGKLIQHSMVDPNLQWEIMQVRDTIDPAHENYNAKSSLAKTVRFDTDGSFVWGDVPDNDPDRCAHADSKMSCIACHSSWNPSCYGCHLPQKANKKMPSLHFEGDVTRNYVSYNFQTLRDDVYMLARDGDVTGNRIGPARSSCAIHVGSYNQNRESIYVQQQTISAEGLSGIAFSTNVPHTVRGGPPHVARLRDPEVHRHLPSETKNCTDCHVSEQNDNNAWMAQLLMQGTNNLNFIGRYCWVAAGDHGLEAVVVTEREEPQAVIGSSLHELAFPEDYEAHVANGRVLEEAHEHPGADVLEQLIGRRSRRANVQMVQARGEYLYAACGPAGLRVFDIATIDNKGFSERIVTAPVSPLGQRFYVRTKYATAVAAPTTIAPDPTRSHLPQNREATVHPLYAYLYVADKVEGLILVGAGTLLDGDPTNNFLERAVTFNPDGILCGARNITIAGACAYVCCDAGVVVVSLEDPTKPQVTAVIGAPTVDHPTSVAIQFRYAFVSDQQGLQVFDVTDLSSPRWVSSLELGEAYSVYVARTYAYVAAGKQGLVIVDVENPLSPAVDQVFTAGGRINDLHDVKLGITNVSQFAYLADGKNGMHVVQLTSPETPGNDGFSPRPTPRWIATRCLPEGGHALSISKGVDRDRAVDEAGNQIAVFGRIGARPLNLEEQRRMFLRDGRVWQVSDDPWHPMYGDCKALDSPLGD